VGICFEGAWADAVAVMQRLSAAAPVKRFQFIDEFSSGCDRDRT
jgi:hypothetical protein